MQTDKNFAIGSLLLQNNVFLAPMAGITDKAFRLICKENGAGMVYSEMVSAKGMSYNNKNTLAMLEVLEGEHPVAMQIFGSEPDIMAKMAEKLNDTPIDLIDINMGCPAPKIVKNGEGSALMQNPALIADIVAAVSSASKKPVTIKIRKGFNESSVNAPQIAEIAEKNGASAVALHGRTRSQYYSGVADWDIIKQTKKQLKNIPLIGNGDIFTPEDAKAMIEQTGCDAVMIGRGSRGNPFIFKRTAEYLKTGILLPEPAIEEKFATAKRHLTLLCEFKGEEKGVKEMRGHLANYIKGLKNSTRARQEINKILTQQEMTDFLDRYEAECSQEESVK